MIKFPDVQALPDGTPPNIALSPWEIPCSWCEGWGYWIHIPSNRARVTCDDCDGHGYVLTEEGERLLEFFRRHISTSHRLYIG